MWETEHSTVMGKWTSWLSMVKKEEKKTTQATSPLKTHRTSLRKCTKPTQKPAPGTQAASGRAKGPDGSSLSTRSLETVRFRSSRAHGCSPGFLGPPHSPPPKMGMEATGPSRYGGGLPGRAGAGLAHRRHSGSLGWKQVSPLSLRQLCTLPTSALPAALVISPTLRGVSNYIFRLSPKTTATAPKAPGPPGTGLNALRILVSTTGTILAPRLPETGPLSIYRGAEWGSEGTGRERTAACGRPDCLPPPPCRLSVYPQGRGWADAPLSPSTQPGPGTAQGAQKWSAERTKGPDGQSPPPPGPAQKPGPPPPQP